MSTYEFGPFRLQAEQLFLTHDGTPVALGPKVVETLLALVERPGDVLDKGTLLDRIWPEGFVEEANLAQNVHVLRKTFRRHRVADPIETVPRRGYRFTAPVRRLAAMPPSETAPAPAPQPIPRPALVRRLAAVAAAALFAAASLALASSYGSTPRTPAPGALSANGTRLYQIGRYYWNLRTREGVRTSLSFFQQVVDADPQSARGYAALADANVAMGDYCYGTHQPPVYFARAREYANKALALDPNSAEAHAALGVLALYREGVPIATGELERAIAIDPSYAPAHEWLGIALIARGRVADGVAHLKRAADLDPLSVATIAWLGKAAYMDRRFGDAIAYSHEALELSPRRTDVLTTMGEAYERSGDLERAIDAFKRFGAVDRYYRPQAAALLAQAYARANRRLEAQTQFAYARAHAKDVDPLDLAAAAAAISDPNGRRRRPGSHVHHSAVYA